MPRSAVVSGTQFPSLAVASSLTPEDVASIQDVDATEGLSEAEASRRLDVDGRNELEQVRPPSVLRLVLRATREPFVLLLAAAGTLAVLLGETRDGVLVLLGLLPIVVADVLTQYRGERALAALRAVSAPIARVRRGGRRLQIPAAEVVRGDLVLIRVGDIVPADLRVTASDGLAIDRSVLTGESVPEVALVRADAAGTALVERRSMAFAGTSVVAGHGEGIAVAIGSGTQFGAIAGGLGVRGTRRSPLQRELDRLVRILLVVAVGLIGITTGLGVARGNPLAENLLAGISAAIAAIPEEPPVLLAVVLGLGAYRLLRRGVLVRRLNAEEVLGAVDLVVTDKTGTLTENRLAVASVRNDHGVITDAADRLPILVDALRAEDDAWSDPDAGRSSFTRALADGVGVATGNSRLAFAELVSRRPFDAKRPYASTITRRNGHLEGLAIGAPESILELAPPDAATRRAWIAQIEQAAAEGERIVAVARQADDGPWAMRGLVGFADVLRPGIPDAVASAVRAGIQVVVVTGDHPTTAAAIARQAGIDMSSVVLGGDVDRWSDEELQDRLASLRIVARSTPELKRRIVAAARAAGRLVAVTGDGVNDAPALQAADVAVAMGSGTAVAKEASDLVLGDDSFATLVYGMGEGRRIVDNVQKGLVFLVSTHVALLGFILVATLFGFSQPLLPIQILWLELFIDLATSVAFEREPAEPDVMTRRPRHVMDPLLSVPLLLRLTGAGAFSVVAAVALLFLDPAGLGHGQWLAYTTLVCAQLVRAYANRSLTTPLAQLGWNWFLLGACLLALGIQVSLAALPTVADAFRAVPLTGSEWLLVAAVALAPAVVAEIVRMRGRGPWVA
jgi:Ca2+-transporting ATPase